MKNRGNSRELWTVRIEKWKRSGVSRRRYCAERGVLLSTCEWWRNRLRDPNEITEPNALVEIPIWLNTTLGADIGIVVGRYTVNVPAGVDTKRLEKHRLPWPQSAERAKTITTEQVTMMLAGMDFWHAHERLSCRHVT